MLLVSCAVFALYLPVAGAGATNVAANVTELYLLPHTHAGTCFESVLQMILFQGTHFHQT